MSVLEGVVACAGRWRGTNRLHDPNTSAPEDSPSTAAVIPLLGGRFVRIDYTWAYQGVPQEGSLLVGYDAEADLVTTSWIDTWHMGNKVMACRGAGGKDGAISVQGSYAVPPGPDWGWRMVMTPADGRSLRLVMYNVGPDGREELAVEADYTRLRDRSETDRRPT